MNCSNLEIFTKEKLLSLTNIRQHEIKAGQCIQVLDENKNLAQLAKGNVKYVILTIPEDIGIRANQGRIGASNGPIAFLNYFLNLQSNQYFDFTKLAILGQVKVSDLRQEASQVNDLTTLREITSILDNRVSEIIKEILKYDLLPIIIGGGNNNSYPIIKAFYETKNTAIGCINIDPHLDFRCLEGRHSGNPFSYAQIHGYLDKYAVLGMQENYNNEEMLTRFKNNDFLAISYEDMFLRNKISFKHGLNHLIAYFKEYKSFIGLELDLDSIINMPTSARSPFGLTVEQGLQAIYTLAKSLPTSYLHLSEASPDLGFDDGVRCVGKTLAFLVLAYLKGQEDKDIN